MPLTFIRVMGYDKPHKHCGLQVEKKWPEDGRLNNDCVSKNRFQSCVGESKI